MPLDSKMNAGMKRRDRWVVTMVLAVALSVAGLVASSPANAQQKVEHYAKAQASPDQVKLNSAAVEAILAKDYAKAARLLEASIELGPLNVTWLNLGRAYQKLGKCKKARKAYLSVVTAPAVAQPPSKLVNAKAEQYLDELDTQCKAEEKPGATAKDGGEAQPTKAAPAAKARADAGPKKAAGAGTVTPPPAPPSGGSSTLGWVATIGGGALLVSSGVFYWLAQKDYGEVNDALDNGSVVGDDAALSSMTQRRAADLQDQGDLFSTVALSTAIAGAAATGFGVYWLVTDDGATEVSLGAGAQSVSVSLSGRF